MTFIDIVILIVLALGIFAGYSSGMVKQLASVVAFVIAIIACNAFGDTATEVLVAVMPSAQSWPASHITTHVVAVIMLFLIVVLTVRVLAMFVKGTISALHLGTLDSLGGAVLCTFKYFFFLSILLNLWLVISPNSETLKKQHMLGNKPFECVVDLAPWVLGQVDLPSEKLISDDESEEFTNETTAEGTSVI